jgi:hypothetical protein
MTVLLQQAENSLKFKAYVNKAFSRKCQVKSAGRLRRPELNVQSVKAERQHRPSPVSERSCRIPATPVPRRHSFACFELSASS